MNAEKPGTFDRFAPAVLAVYKQDKEAFWDAVMSPFLSGSSLLAIARHYKVGWALLSALRGLDGEITRELRAFSTPLGFDVTKWSSLRTKYEYFKDFYPIYAFLVVWMNEEGGLEDVLARFPDFMRSIAYGIAGYAILDVNLDSESSSPTEILVAQALIAEYETRLLEVFGVSAINLGILHRIRSLFLAAEIKEKRLRGQASPYSSDVPRECGYKAAHLLTPFMLCLDRVGKAGSIDAYFDVFFDFGAVIQILDDWKDLPDDLAIGHYSLVSIGFERQLRQSKPRELARLISADRAHVRKVYEMCKALIASAEQSLARLGDPVLGRIVMVTDLRLEAYFRKELRLA